MADSVYEIMMYTPLGSKKGMMSCRIKNGIINGQLYILKHSEPFEGVIDEDGNCKIKGKIVTMLKAACYTGIGRITASLVELKVYYGRGEYELCGTPLKKN